MRKTQVDLPDTPSWEGVGNSISIPDWLNWNTPSGSNFYAIAGTLLVILVAGRMSSGSGKSSRGKKGRIIGLLVFAGIMFVVFRFFGGDIIDLIPRP